MERGRCRGRRQRVPQPCNRGPRGVALAGIPSDLSERATAPVRPRIARSDTKTVFERANGPRAGRVARSNMPPAGRTPTAPTAPTALQLSSLHRASFHRCIADPPNPRRPRSRSQHIETGGECAPSSATISRPTRRPGRRRTSPPARSVPTSLPGRPPGRCISPTRDHRPSEPRSFRPASFRKARKQRGPTVILTTAATAHPFDGARRSQGWRAERGSRDSNPDSRFWRPRV